MLCELEGPDLPLHLQTDQGLLYLSIYLTLPNDSISGQ